MQNGKNIVVVLQAYNAERTLTQTFADVPPGIINQFLLVDDASQDITVALRMDQDGGSPQEFI